MRVSFKPTHPCCHLKQSENNTPVTVAQSQTSVEQMICPGCFYTSVQIWIGSEQTYLGWAPVKQNNIVLIMVNNKHYIISNYCNGTDYCSKFLWNIPWSWVTVAWQIFPEIFFCWLDCHVGDDDVYCNAVSTGRAILASCKQEGITAESC